MLLLFLYLSQGTIRIVPLVSWYSLLSSVSTKFQAVFSQSLCLPGEHFCYLILCETAILIPMPDVSSRLSFHPQVFLSSFALSCMLHPFRYNIALAFCGLAICPYGFTFRFHKWPTFLTLRSTSFDVVADLSFFGLELYRVGY